MAAVSCQCRLACVALQRERYDIAIGSRDYIEWPLQRLLAFARTPRFLEKATELNQPSEDWYSAAAPPILAFPTPGREQG